MMSNVCDLRHVAGNTKPYFAVVRDDMLVLTSPPNEAVTCRNCGNVHVRVLSHVTPKLVRELAQQLRVLADTLEGR